MKTIYKTYKYLIKPNEYQESKIYTTFQCCTFVYNAYIIDCKKNGVKKILAKYILEEYRKRNNFLATADQSALMNVLFKLQDKGEGIKFMETKKKNVNYYITSNLYKRSGIFVDDSSINIPYIGTVKATIYRKLPDNIKILTATIKKDNTNTYYCYISFSYLVIDSNKKLDINNIIGLDYSSPFLYVDSNGQKSNMMHFYKPYEKKISKIRRKLSKCKKNSIKYYKIKNQLSKLCRHVSNQRKDFLHKLSTKLANEYDYICVEDLDMQKIATHYNLAKNTYDNGYSTFLKMIKYKMEERKKELIIIHKYYPSSKRCNMCGYINNELTISDRIWICPKCHSMLDRDVNAAKNILEEGKKIIKKI